MNDRQMEVYWFIKSYIYEHGYSPSHRDIVRGTGHTSTSVVAYMLKKLQSSGYINIKKGASRGVTLTDKLPIVGHILKNGVVTGYIIKMNKEVYWIGV